MKKAVGPPAIIAAVVVALGLVWFLWQRSTSPANPVIKGEDIQKPSGMQPDPASLPPGGAPPGAPVGGVMAAPPGKGGR